MNGRLLIAALAVIVSSSCDDSTPVNVGGSPSIRSTAFSGELRCPDGNEPGGAGWDYGPNPKGTTRDAVAWVRTHARGMDQTMTLSFMTVAGDREDIVVASSTDGAALAFVDFDVDGHGRYLPVEAEACSSSGIDDFNG